MFCFFFSSRRRHTRCYRDWSSDVCSSDLSFSALAAYPKNAGRLGPSNRQQSAWEPAEALHLKALDQDETARGVFRNSPSRKKTAACIRDDFGNGCALSQNSEVLELRRELQVV